jgi:hypothetical protein
MVSNDNVPRPPDPADFVLELHALPSGWRTGPVQRLRALLKAALRGYGFRCTSVRPMQAEPDKEKL